MRYQLKLTTLHLALFHPIQKQDGAKQLKTSPPHEFSSFPQQVLLALLAL
jgi:hypothetical protein